MSLRSSLKNLIRRDAERPSLRERAADLRASLSRRTVVAGSIAAAVPLPAIAAPAVSAPALPHPDAELVALGERWLRARAAQDEAMEAWGIAYRQVYAVIKTCPPELFSTHDERFQVLGGWRWPTLLGVNLRHVALDWGTEESHTEQAWTGEALRIAIARAVPMLGQGGKTPGRIRRWKAMLPIADAFDARVEVVETATDRRRLEKARRVAEDEFRDLNREIGQHVATTPEGMAALVRVIGRYPWKDTGGAWANLLLSAANVSGIDPASLDHEHDSINGHRA
ncbi:hypothetical protein [Methylobacterium pseudosasicola]|uniref:Uncharacterized protein n=1 Tax=Methylobacterium pseudosasicola TaxID=582667 RepID=A0A1I4SAL5_9HYPH|nr:hypothetical protein [Methylobacterium pseudosasicola]SFM61515.1 hypothetical protein SAMN05192568_104120 [Methylobacterium pseudosasicola]